MFDNSTLIDIHHGIQEIHNTADFALLNGVDEAMNGARVEQLVGLCHKLSESVVGMWQQARQGLFDGKLDDKIDEMDLVLSKVFDCVPQVFDYAEKTVDFFTNRGREIVGFSTLSQAKSNVIAAKEEFERDWPRVNMHEIEASINAIHCGHYFTLSGVALQDAKAIGHS